MEYQKDSSIIAYSHYACKSRKQENDLKRGGIYNTDTTISKKMQFPFSYFFNI